MESTEQVQDPDAGEARRAPERPALVLVVCAANRGRSPAAAAILRRLLRERGLEGSLTVESAGLCTYELDRTGLPADPAVAAVCEHHGLDLSDHVARPLDRGLVERAAVVVTMEGWQKTALATAYRDLRDRIVTLAEVGGDGTGRDIADTSGAPDEEIERFLADAERCFAEGLRAGVLHDLLAGAGARTRAEWVQE